MKKILICIFLFSTNVYAVPRCNLDVTNPAITQGFIPIDGGSLQGITGYNNPSEWVFMSGQSHGAPANMMTYDASQGLLNPNVGHVHLEVCFPYLGALQYIPNVTPVTNIITIPFRIQIFHSDGVLGNLSGPMVRNVVWDDPTVGWPVQIHGDPMGVVIKTGHFSYGLDAGGGCCFHSPNPDGWTQFSVGAEFRFTNDNIFDVEIITSMRTKYNSIWPSNSDAGPMIANNAQWFTAGEPAGVWGYSVIEVNEPLPLLAPFNTAWQIPSMRAYSYAAAGALADGTRAMRKDMDLHNGNAGTDLTSWTIFDPVKMGTGIHKIAMIWSNTSGPNGVPGVAGPNENVLSLLVVNVEVGNEVTPPQICQDSNATNFGGPLPCIYPVVPIWNLGTVFWHDKVFELCPGNNPNDLACVIQ